MTANRDLILAGVSGGGSAGTSLAMFAPVGTTLPTAVDEALHANFRDPGWVTEEGLKRLVEEEQVKVKAYGTSQTVRTLKTTREARFDIGFLESNPVSVSVYHQLPLTGTGSITPDVDGAFDFTEGASRTQLYAAVFHIVDGLNHIMAVCPTVEPVSPKDFEARAGAPIPYGVSLVAYPGSDNVAIHWYYLLNALATP